jgi:hypothetical protein
MGNSVKSLKTLLGHFDSGELVLPEIQRDFVWNKQHVLTLFDSLYRRLPIGSMLVWKAKTVVPEKGKTFRKGELINTFYGYLLDGQQRLTALQKVRDGDETYPLNFYLKPVRLEDKYEGRFQYLSKKNKNNLWYVPVADVLSPEFSMKKYIDDLVLKYSSVETINQDEILGYLTRLKTLFDDYQIGVIEFEEDNYEKATQLFIRFNSTGKKLNKSDLTSAELALQVRDLVSERIKPIATKYNRYPFTMPFLIQSLAAVHKGKMQFKSPYEIWDGTNDYSIRQSWKKAEKGIDKTIEFLSGTIKWDSIQWLPSINALLPIIYILSNTKFSSKERKIAKKWLILSTAHAYFSGSVYTTLDKILRKLSKNNRCSFSTLWKITRKELPYLEPEFFSTKRKIGAVMSLYISMIRKNKAEDWINHSELSGNVIGHNSELQIHHFFPQALLRENGYGTDLINTFANYVIISKDTNINISNEEPYKYILKHKINKRHLRSQCIPLSKNLWRVSNYKKFLSERRKLLADSAKKFLY